PSPFVVESIIRREGRTVGRIRFSLRRLMVVTGLTAACFAALGVTAGGIISTSVLAFAFAPFSSLRASCEFSLTTAWLLGVAVLSSDVWTDGFEIVCFFIPTGLLLGLSWVLRSFEFFEKPRSRWDWFAWCFTPAAGLLSYGLLNT